MRRLSLVMCLLAWGLFPCACLRLAREPLSKTRYALQATREPGQRDPEGPVLQVRPLVSASGHEGRGLVYRTGEHTYARDFYHELFLSPAPAVTSLVMEWLRDGGHFSSVVSPGSYLPVDLSLEGEILELHGDYREDTARAVVTLSLLALRLPREGPPVVLFQRRMTGMELLADDSPEELVRGLGAALGRVLSELDGVFGEALGAPSGS